MRRVTFGLMLALTIALVACARQEPAPRAAAPPAPAFKPIATVKQVMQGITIPASNAVFAVAGQAPADDAAWQAVEASAMAVAESGNLLLMSPRAVAEQEWTQYAVALIDAGAKAAEAARAKNADQTSTAGDDMYNVCEQCHAKYMKKP